MQGCVEDAEAANTDQAADATQYKSDTDKAAETNASAAGADAVLPSTDATAVIAAFAAIPLMPTFQILEAHASIRLSESDTDQASAKAHAAAAAKAADRALLRAKHDLGLREQAKRQAVHDHTVAEDKAREAFQEVRSKLLVPPLKHVQ